MTQLLNHLRQKHPRFYYHSYSVTHTDKSLIFGFDLEIEPHIHFSPKVIIENVDCQKINIIGQEVLNNIAFHLGLMEIPSYWKAACSPEIVIRAGTLDEFQILWWQDLLYKGLGEFFYKNNIDFTVSNFVNYKINGDPCSRIAPYKGRLNNKRLLLPIGGGKDSAVSRELLKKANKEIVCWLLNPTSSILEHIKANQDERPITVVRNIDKTLLKMNENGYLNGHTPFSAYLAFASAACAILFGHRDIALSNERSSNEGNVSFKGIEINHQYSKSFDFEKRFRDYSIRYLADEINYFSLLRPLYELQIARLFSGFTHLFPFFSSCNKKQEGNRWCHKCPKCLFVFTILYPFVEDNTLTTEIFSKNLFNDNGLIQTAFDLLGIGETKPFECVGSREETTVAFYLCIKKLKNSKKSLPVVLQSVDDKVFVKEKEMENRAHTIINAWNDQHAMPNDIDIALH